MPTPTYTLIQEQVLGSAAASVTFSSIPGTYKDLVLEIFAQGTTTNGATQVNFNSDTSANYSRTFMTGNGSTATSARGTNMNLAYTGLGVSGSFGPNYLYMMSYANTNVFKTSLGRYVVDSSASVRAEVNLWRSTAAITTILLAPVSPDTFASGSTFRLWGVAG